jgi:hypothetical protein
MEAASASETSVNFYKTTQRNNPEDSHLRTCRRESLKSHKELLVRLIGVNWCKKRVRYNPAIIEGKKQE